MADSKTKILRQLAQDVGTLKSEMIVHTDKTEKIAGWVKNNFRPGLESLKKLIEEELQLLKPKLSQCDERDEKLRIWVRDVLGGKLEKVKEMLDTSVVALLEKQAEEAQAREESLWKIFNIKIDALRQQMMDFQTQMQADKEKLILQVKVIREEVNKMHQERLELEEVRKNVDQTYTNLEAAAKQKPTQLIEAHNQFITQISNEKKRINDAAQELTAEKNKLIQQLEEERQKIETRIALDRERSKLESIRQQLDRDKQQMLLTEEKLYIQEEKKKILHERKLAHERIEIERAKYLEERSNIEMELVQQREAFESQKRALNTEEQTRKEKIYSKQLELDGLIKEREEKQRAELLRKESEDRDKMVKEQLTTKVARESVLSSGGDSRSSVVAWLRDNGFGGYVDKFFSCGYDSLEVISILDSTDLDLLEISLPHHRTALLSASEKLRASMRGQL